MNRLFNPENPVMQFIGKLGYSIALNLIWFITSIPIITIGASTTALFRCSERLVQSRYDGLFREYFSSFKANFKQATLAWLVMLFLGILLGVDGYALSRLYDDGIFWTMITAIFIIALAAYCIILMYLFPLLAHFDNTLLSMFKNSLLIGMRFLICTVLMFVIYAGMGFLIVNIFTPLIFMGMGTCGLLCSYLLSNILVQCEPADIEKENAL